MPALRGDDQMAIRRNRADIAREWWRGDETRPLPGEAGMNTVFVVAYEDGCRYLGYTGRSVVRRLSELMAGPFVRGSDAFVREHGQRVPYLVYCVESGLDKRQAQQLRDRLVSEAPIGVYWADGATVTTSRCWLREGGTDAQVMSFGEWIKTREMQPSRAVSE